MAILVSRSRRSDADARPARWAWPLFGVCLVGLGLGLGVGCGGRTALAEGAGDGAGGPQTGASGSGGAEGDAGRPSVLLFGGADESGTLDDTWKFDGATWSQLRPSASPPARSQPVMATLGDRVVLFGGEDSAGWMNDTWIFDGSTWTELVTSQPPPERSNAMVATLGEKVLLFGGVNESGWLADTWTFDGVTWSPVATTPGSPSVGATGPMATLCGQVLLFWGNSSWSFDASGWTETDEGYLCDGGPAAAGLPGYVGVTTLANQLVGFGGSGPGVVLDGTWTFGAMSCWSSLSIASRPAPRSLAGMTTLGSEVVLFGGCSDSECADDFLGDTWTFDGARWSPVATGTAAPSNRYGAVMATFPSGR